MYMRQMINVYSIFDGNSDVKKPLGLPKRRREYNTELRLKRIGCDWIHLGLSRVE
jgi:hypothetical protein